MLAAIYCLSWQSSNLSCVFRCLGCTHRAVAVLIETIELRSRCVAFYSEEHKAWKDVETNSNIEPINLRDRKRPLGKTRDKSSGLFTRLFVQHTARTRSGTRSPWACRTPVTNTVADAPRDDSTGVRRAPARITFPFIFFLHGSETGSTLKIRHRTVNQQTAGGGETLKDEAQLVCLIFEQRDVKCSAFKYSFEGFWSVLVIVH